MPFSLKSKIQISNINNHITFDEYFRQFKDEMNQRQTTSEENILDKKASLGESAAVNHFFNLIQQYISKNEYNGDLPEGYYTLHEAIFYEWKSIGVLYHWFYDKEYLLSTGLQVIGKNVFYKIKGKYKQYPYTIKNIEKVEHIIRTLTLHQPKEEVTENKPKAEFDIPDPLYKNKFLRIAIWFKGRVWNGFHTITIRRYISNLMFLEEQANKQTLPNESILFIRDLIKLGVRILVVGAVNSGKTTFANTIVAELIKDNPDDSIVMIENHPESNIPYVFKKNRIIPIIAKQHELMEVGIESLRHDPNIVFMTEMRKAEWEFYLFCAQKGHKSVIGTFHTDVPEDIPYQAAIATYQNGGSFKGQIISALNACQIIITMQEQGEFMRVVKVSELQFDLVKNNVQSLDLMRYNNYKNSWEYANPDLSMLGKSKDKDKFNKFYLNLKSLHEKNPLLEPINVSLVTKKALEGE